MERSLGIVVPAYDPDVQRLERYVQSLQSLAPAEIRIEVDDPSNRVRDALDDLPATVNVATARRGKGAAVTAGFEALETDVYAFADADGSTYASSLAAVVEPVLDRRADLATGSRRHPDATITDSQSRVRGGLGDLFAWCARRAVPVDLHDYQCGAKAIDADAWAAVRDELYESGFGWDIELVAAAGRHGLRVEEVPIRWSDSPGSTVDLVGTSLGLGRTLARVVRVQWFGSAGTLPLVDRLPSAEVETP